MFIIGKIIFFSEGLLFIHSQYGSITLSKNHISTIKFYDPVITPVIQGDIRSCFVVKLYINDEYGKTFDINHYAIEIPVPPYV